MGLFRFGFSKIKIMLMPKKNLVSIYEHLFREGVMVAKKDPHAPKHPELEAVPNLHVIKALPASNPEDTLRNSSHGGTTIGILPTRVSDTSAATFICPQRSCPPPSRDSQGLTPDQGQAPPLVAVVLATNPQMVIARLTGEHLAPTAIRLELLDLVLPPWNSEEDLVEARRNKFIMSKLKKG